MVGLGVSTSSNTATQTSHLPPACLPLSCWPERRNENQELEVKARKRAVFSRRKACSPPLNSTTGTDHLDTGKNVCLSLCRGPMSCVRRGDECVGTCLILAFYSFIDSPSAFVLTRPDRAVLTAHRPPPGAASTQPHTCFILSSREKDSSFNLS